MSNSTKTIFTLRILVTGVAGFIGFHVAKRLLKKGYYVIGVDNLNNYYDISLKNNRLQELKIYNKFHFIKGDIKESQFVTDVFDGAKPSFVIHLAAQAGVRYSITHPRPYIDSNIIGFFNILEGCRFYNINHLVFASSSSVYGNQKKVPFSTSDDVSLPVSLYAATKRTNELMAYTYSHLYGIPATGLRFFTVYGPWGRPDMAYYKFTYNILNDIPIKIFNHGNMMRDFTYIDDIVDGIEMVMEKAPVPDADGISYKIYNLGKGHPESIMDFIGTLENTLGKKAQKEYCPMQPGDVYQTYADTKDIVNDFGFFPCTSLETGLKNFVAWYKEYNRVQ